MWRPKGQRQGSPWTGLGAVVAKEMADHLSSVRMRLLEGLIVLTAIGAVYAAAQALKGAGDTPFLFLRLFTTGSGQLPSFVSFLGFLLPLAAIALGFDAINSEYSRRTLSRVLAQPIYRDALLLGKFLAALFTLALTLLALWLLVAGLSLVLLGLPPNPQEVARSLAFLLASLAYAGVWLGLAMFFSSIFRQPATSALAALAVWLLFTVFWPIIVGLVSPLLPVGQNPLTAELVRARDDLFLNRLSPNTLFAETTLALLNPSTRSLGPVFFSQLQGALIGAPLPFMQSVILSWPQLTGLIAAMIALFSLTYVVFQRQEIRA